VAKADILVIGGHGYSWQQLCDLRRQQLEGRRRPILCVISVRSFRFGVLLKLILREAILRRCEVDP
jgi:hypothetical protein